MPVDNSLDDRQAEACSLEFIDTVQPLKYAEQFADITHVETNAVILHIEDILIAFGFPSYFNDRRVPFTRELQRIGKQIDQNLADQKTITDRPGQIFNPQIDGSSAFPCVCFAECIVSQFGHIHFRRTHGLPPQSRESEQTVDKVSHLYGTVADDIENPASLRIKL